MTYPLRILHLEDNPTDAELAQATLESDGIECQVTRVETRADFLAAVEQGGFDLILADYSLPSFDGLSALEIAREKRPDVPFIFLSGTLGEEVAIESLKNGARDYVLKGRLARLASSVRRALRESEERTARQRAEAAVRASEKRFRALIENSSDGIVLLSAEGTVLYDSPAVTRILGYAPDERIGRTVFEFMHPDDRQANAERFVQLARKHGAVVRSQSRFRHKDDSWRWIEGIRSNLLDEPGVQAIVVNYRDVTDRVRAEQRLAAQYAVARCLTESGTLADAVPKILQAICASLEWDHGEVWSALWSPDSQANVLRCVGTWQPPSPSFPEFEAATRQIEFAPGVGLPGRVWASGEPAWIPDVTQDANFPRAPFAAKEGLRAGFAFPLKPDGGIFGVMGFFSREIRQPDNDLLQMFTSLSNQIGQFIKRVRAEEALKESEEYFRSLIENASDVITVLDSAGTILYESPSIEQVLGYKPEELLGRNAFELVHPDDLADIVETFTRGFQSREITPLVEARFRHKDDSWRAVEMIGKPAPDRTGQMIGIVNSRDISDRKRAEEETRLLLALTQAINEAPDFDSALRVALQKVCESTDWDMGEAWIPRADGSVLELSPNWYGQRPGLEKFITDSQSFAFPPGEGLPGRVWASRQSEWLKDVSVDGEIFPRAALAIETGIKAALAVPTVTGDQTLVLVFFMREAREEERRLVEIVSAAAAQLGSLFQRKRAEERLRQSEERYRTLAEAAHDSIFIINRDGYFEYVNSFAARQFGLQSEEIIGKPVALLFPPEMLKARQQDLQTVFESGQPLYIEYQRSFPDAREVWLGARLAPILDVTGAVRAVLGISRDITERKRAEESLWQAEEKYRGIFEDAVVGIYQTTPEGHFLMANPTLARTFGYESPEALLQAVTDLNRQFYVEPGRRAEFIRRVQEQGSVSHFESQVYRRDGSMIWISEEARAVRDAGGRLARFEGTMVDITERKQAEEKSHLFQALTNQVNDTIEVLDPKTGRFLDVNEKGCLDLGYSREEFLALSVFDIETAVDPSRFLRMVEDLRKQGVLLWEGFHRRKNGSTYPVEVNIKYVQLDRDYIVTVVRDITERKQAEAQIMRQLQRITGLRTIDTTITSSFDLRLTLGVVLDEATAQLGVDAADVLLFNPHLQTLEYAAGRGFRGRAIERSRFRIGEGQAGRAALERKTISDFGFRNADFGNDLPQSAIRVPQLDAEGFVAHIAVPLIAKGEVKGVLEIFHRSPLKPDSEWLAFLETLAGQAAIAIDNSQLFDGLQRSNLELSLAYDATIEGWSHALDLRDKETEGHTLRVTEITLRLAQAMGISEEELVHLRRGALLHDIGKMGVPDSILLKPGPLTDEEWVIMRRHPTYAYEMLAPINYLHPALDIPYCHHEKWDGTGYPRGLTGEQIPLAARLFAIVDVWDALRSDRPYRAAWPEAKVREYLREQAGTHFDPQVVEMFLALEQRPATRGP